MPKPSDYANECFYCGVRLLVPKGSQSWVHWDSQMSRCADGKHCAVDVTVAEKNGRSK